MKIDAHNHIGEKKGVKYTVEEMIENMNSNLIDKAVVFSFPEQINNQYVAESVNKHPDRLIGFVTINPWHTNAEEEAQKYLKEYNFKGIKLHPLRHGYAINDLELLAGVMNTCQVYKVPLLVYGGASSYSIPNMFEELAENYPDVIIIISHGGQMYATKAVISACQRHSNLYIETSTMFPKRLNSAIEANLTERIIYGSDMPYGDVGLEIEKINILKTSEATLTGIFSENFMSIYRK